MEHGTRRNYRAGCRCDLCRRANTEAENERRRRVSPPLPPCAAEGCEVRSNRGASYCALHQRAFDKWGDPLLTFFTVPAADRVRTRTIEDPYTGCWVWQRAVNPNGYGITWEGTRTVMAHRFAYEAIVGPIPEGLHLDHLCRNRRCVNPDHLEAVTQAENNRRSNAIRWAKAKQ